MVNVLHGVTSDIGIVGVQVKEENVALASHLTEVQSQKQELQAQLARLQDEWSAANSNNLRLMEEVSTKHNSLQVRITLSPCHMCRHAVFRPLYRSNCS